MATHKVKAQKAEDAGVPQNPVWRPNSPMNAGGGEGLTPGALIMSGRYCRTLTALYLQGLPASGWFTSPQAGGQALQRRVAR